MNTLKQCIWTSIFVILVSGCATQPHVGALIINPTERLEFDGISVLPPQEENWFLGSSPFLKDMVVFKKKLSDFSRFQELHSYLAVVSRTDLDGELTNPQDLLSYVNSKLKITQARFQMITSNTVLDEARSNAMDSICVQYDIAGKEFDNPSFPDTIFILALHGFECRHPFSSKVVIEAYCTERYPDGEQPVGEALKNECATFLNNIQFKPLRTQNHVPDLSVSDWKSARWQQMIAAVEWANEQNNKITVDKLCYQAIHYADTNTIKSLYKYADLLEAQKREEGVAVRAKADKLIKLKTQQAQRTESKTTYLGFAPSEMLSEYANLLEGLLQTAEAESMRTLSRAYRYTQEVRANRLRVINEGGDPRGLCTDFD